jgi:hypothetical protein
LKNKQQKLVVERAKVKKNAGNGNSGPTLKNVKKREAKQNYEKPLFLVCQVIRIKRIVKFKVSCCCL